MMDYKQKIIEMVDEIDNAELLESIYWFVRTIFVKFWKGRIEIIKIK